MRIWHRMVCNLITNKKPFWSENVVHEVWNVELDTKTNENLKGGQISRIQWVLSSLLFLLSKVWSATCHFSLSVKNHNFSICQNLPFFLNSWIEVGELLAVILGSYSSAESKKIKMNYPFLIQQNGHEHSHWIQAHFSYGLCTLIILFPSPFPSNVVINYAFFIACESYVQEQLLFIA